MWRRNDLAFSNPIFGPATKASSFEPLGLSKAIGSEGNFLVKLIVVINSASAGVICSFRPQGNSGDFQSSTLGPEGTVVVALVQGEAAAVEIVTNDESTIQWETNDPAATISIFVEGWLDISSIDPLAQGTPISSTMPLAAWPGTTVDLSGISNANSLFLLQYNYNSGFLQESVAVRSADDSDDLMGVDGASTFPGGCNRWHFKTSPDDICVLTPSNDDGEIQHIASSSATNVDIFTHCYIDASNGWNRVDTIHIFEETPSTSWEDIDISGIVGERRAYVFLKINRQTGIGVGTIQKFAVRSPDSDDHEFFLGIDTQQGGSQLGSVDAGRAVYLAVATDENGVFQRRASSNAYKITVTVLGYILNPSIQVVSTILKTRNTAEITFDNEPVHIDPEDPVSVTNISNWAISFPMGAPETNRNIQTILYVGNNTVQIIFDGPLDPGIGYVLTISNIESTEGGVFIPSNVFFITYDKEKDALEPVQPTEQQYDLANPQLPSQAGANQSLGTLYVDDTGDYTNDSGRDSLKKRIIRRITTIPGGFFHLPNYGVTLREGTLLTSTELRRLQIETESQTRQEPEVINARTTVSQIQPGIVRLNVRVQDSTGMFEVAETLDLTEVS